MANELELNVSFTYRDGDSEVDNSADDPTFVDIVTLTYYNAIQSVGTSAEAVQVGDVSSPGFVFMRNLDPTNYVDVYASNGGDRFARMYPGEPCLLRLGPDASAPYIIANTAACRVGVTLFST